jgi:hypothetical protein
VSPVKRKRWRPLSHRKAVAPLVCPGVGITSKSSSSMWRWEKVASTRRVLATDSRSFSWTTSGAVTQSEANMASWRWFRYWRETPPRSSIAGASDSSAVTL